MRTRCRCDLREASRSEESGGVTLARIIQHNRPTFSWCYSGVSSPTARVTPPPPLVELWPQNGPLAHSCRPCYQLVH